MEDPRLRSRRFVQLTFPSSSSSVGMVEGTGVSLSQRFKTAPQNQGLRMNSFGASSNDLEDDDEGFGSVMRPMFRRSVSGMSGSEKVSVLRASKDAEILRLKSELAQTQKQLQTAKMTGRLGVPGNLRLIESRSCGKVLRNNIFDGNDGVNKPQRRLKRLSADTMSRPRGIRWENNDRRRKNSGSRHGKDFGSPKSKDELDSELDTYMSKRRSKLDQELDEYMVARAQSVANNEKTDPNGTIPTSPAVANFEDAVDDEEDKGLVIDDVDMEGPI